MYSLRFWYVPMVHQPGLNVAAPPTSDIYNAFLVGVYNLLLLSLVVFSISNINLFLQWDLGKLKSQA